MFLFENATLNNKILYERMSVLKNGWRECRSSSEQCSVNIKDEVSLCVLVIARVNNAGIQHGISSRTNTFFIVIFRSQGRYEFAAKGQHLSRFLLNEQLHPMLAHGKWLLCDSHERSTPSSLYELTVNNSRSCAVRDGAEWEAPSVPSHDKSLLFRPVAEALTSPLGVPRAEATKPCGTKHLCGEVVVKLYEFNVKNYEKAKSKYSNRMRLERASQKQSSDTHKTQYVRVKRCRERKKNQDVRARQRRPVSKYTSSANLPANTSTNRWCDIMERGVANQNSPTTFTATSTAIILLAFRQNHVTCLRRYDDKILMQPGCIQVNSSAWRGSHNRRRDDNVMVIVRKTLRVDSAFFVPEARNNEKYGGFPYFVFTELSSVFRNYGSHCQLAISQPQAGHFLMNCWLMSGKTRVARKLTTSGPLLAFCFWPAVSKPYVVSQLLVLRGSLPSDFPCRYCCTRLYMTRIIVSEHEATAEYEERIGSARQIRLKDNLATSLHAVWEEDGREKIFDQRCMVTLCKYFWGTNFVLRASSLSFTGISYDENGGSVVCYSRLRNFSTRKCIMHVPNGCTNLAK
ncbi:hypothetical protein PR048_017514 [Dryococelus australis]|uniref:Uncharacterized protein n=1 Tax=Dryococelus australis TaxID=614101 RepID=A0ABQ9H9Q3_9NEOP|nr:hypothetical protein PR048_017514 [Dryococelus australis]